MMRKYDEFKRQAVKKILDGQSLASVSRELGVAEGILHAWEKAKLARSSSSEQEVVELKKRLKEVEMEKAHSKKGGKGNCPRHRSSRKFFLPIQSRIVGKRSL
ncbi:MAG: transposase [Pyrinomonadaceae bacterium]